MIENCILTNINICAKSNNSLSAIQGSEELEKQICKSDTVHNNISTNVFTNNDLEEQSSKFQNLHNDYDQDLLENTDQNKSFNRISEHRINDACTTFSPEEMLKRNTATITVFDSSDDNNNSNKCIVTSDIILRSKCILTEQLSNSEEKEDIQNILESNSKIEYSKYRESNSKGSFSSSSKCVIQNRKINFL